MQIGRVMNHSRSLLSMLRYALACAMPLACGSASPSPAPTDLALTFRATQVASGSFDVVATLTKTDTRSNDCAVGVGLYGWCDAPTHVVRATLLSSACDADACRVTTVPSSAGDLHFVVVANAPTFTLRVRAQSADGETIEATEPLPH